MKKRIISIFTLLVLFTASTFGITTNIAIAQSKQDAKSSQNETAPVDEVSNKTYTLEELLNDEEEQEEVKKYIEKVSKTEKKEEDKEEKAVLTISSNVDYNRPSAGGSTRYIRGTSVFGKDFYMNTSTSHNPNTGVTKSYFRIYKHDVINNTNNLVYDASSENSYKVSTYVNNNILYVLYIKDYNTNTKEYSTSNVVGIDLNTEQVVLKQTYDCILTSDFYASFAVDSEQRVYFVYDSDGIKVFDKNAKLVYHQEPSGKDNGYFIYLKGVSPNDKILFFETMFRSSPNDNAPLSIYEGMQKLNNGTFVVKDGFTVYGRTFPNNWSYNPIWYFLDNNGTYAADQYGRIAKFDYDVDSNMGCDREILINLQSNSQDIRYSPNYPNVCKNGNNVYILGSNGNIYIVNINTLQYSQYLATGIQEYTDIKSITYMEQSLFVLTQSSFYYIMKQFKLDNSNLNTIQNKVITESNTTSHTIADIVAKYKQTSPKFDYNNSIYKTNPRWSNPYAAGSLKDQVVTDTINRLNYYRWLVGVNEIGVNYDKLDRNQKGAVISKANGDISHYPDQPSDMDDAFYEEAYDGCNAGYTEGDIYSGNVSVGDWRPYQAIESFVSDLYNVTIGSATGHRQSMLDPKATAISFGQCEEYSTASVYYDDSKDVTSSAFYAFPSAGYFPNTEMAVSEYWSIYLTGNVSGTASVNFKYNGKTYRGTGLLFESGYPALSFRMPDELQKQLGNTYDNIPGGTKIEVEVVGLKDDNLNNVTYRYSVNFFDMKSEMPSSQDVANLIFDYKFYADKYPDLKAAFGYNESALKNHWLTDGIREGRQPSAVFDPKYYVYNNEDIWKAYGNDYVSAYNHFITTGYSELRPSSNEYYGTYYKNRYGDLSGLSAFRLMRHYLINGRQEGRIATDVIDRTPIDIKPYLFDATIYGSANQDVKNAYNNNTTKLESHWTNVGIKEGRVASLVFDAKYYLEKYPDIKNAYGNDYQKAYNHFVNIGIYEGKQGSRFFDPKYYLEKYPELEEIYGKNYSKALEHFITVGLNEGKIGSSEFNVIIYKENYADLRNAYGNNYVMYYRHYMNVGVKEGKNATTSIVKTLSELEEYLYSAEVYASANQDVKNAYNNDAAKLKSHWINVGIKEGRIASLVFDAEYYLNNNEDVKAAYGNNYEKAYNHFVNVGIYEGRQGSMFFDPKYYLNNNGDLKPAYGNDYVKALKHFVTNGIAEGRTASNKFSCKTYKANYGDLRNAYGDNNIKYFLHYMNVGIKENRKAI